MVLMWPQSGRIEDEVFRQGDVGRSIFDLMGSEVDYANVLRVGAIFLLDRLLRVFGYCDEAVRMLGRIQGITPSFR